MCYLQTRLKEKKPKTRSWLLHWPGRASPMYCTLTDHFIKRFPVEVRTSKALALSVQSFKWFHITSLINSVETKSFSCFVKLSSMNSEESIQENCSFFLGVQKLSCLFRETWQKHISSECIKLQWSTGICNVAWITAMHQTQGRRLQASEDVYEKCRKQIVVAKINSLCKCYASKEMYSTCLLDIQYTQWVLLKINETCISLQETPLGQL